MRSHYYYQLYYPLLTWCPGSGREPVIFAGQARLRYVPKRSRDRPPAGKACHFECTALAPLRQQHADLFTPRTGTMRSFFGQQNHLGVLHYVIECLDFMNI